MANGAGGTAAAGSAAGSSTTIVSPPASAGPFGRRSPSTVTWPPSIRRWAAERDPAWPARYTSRRSPAAPGGTVSSSAIWVGGGPRPLARARRSLQHVDQRDHAEGYGHVRDVEGREMRELHEV